MQTIVTYDVTLVMARGDVILVTRNLPSPRDCIRDAVLTVSPKRQKRGIFIPTTPATQSPARRTSISPGHRRGHRGTLWDARSTILPAKVREETPEIGLEQPAEGRR